SLQKIEKNRKNESAATNEVLYRTFVTNDNDKKRSPSPLLSLMPTNLTRDSIDLSIPDYPRLTTGNKFWHRKRAGRD
ncbi:unnamed protein product, partial [Onchocerca ochengi]|uniref:Ovule protein n=1 Tax=Onchocerca ochengi TaxID=42157 RepID=A0A182EAN6_ONCOC